MTKNLSKSPTEKDLDEFLALISAAPGERLRAESYCHENLLPHETAEADWRNSQMPKNKAGIARAAERRGLIVHQMEPWPPDGPEMLGPSGSDRYYTLTGAGQERLMHYNRGWIVRYAVQIRDSIPIIVVAMLTALVLSWLGLKK